MPIYPFRCDTCTRELEEFQNMSDYHVPNCPDCSEKMRRLYAAHKTTGFGIDGKILYDMGEKPIKVHSAKEADAVAAAHNCHIDTLRR